MKVSNGWKLIVVALSMSMGSIASGRENPLDKKVQSVDVRSASGWHCTASAAACAAQYQGLGLGGGRFTQSRTTCTGSSSACTRFVELAVDAKSPNTTETNDRASSTLRASR
jgi:hypothetical protein